MKKMCADSNNDTPLISIIILTHNGLRYTKQCIESISTHTKENYELIFIDNASQDQTLDFLHSIPNATVIANSINRGFPAGCNQGFSAANGDYIVILNNDTIVTKGWLTGLIRWLEIDETIGIAGPRSNYVLKEQAVSRVAYKTKEELQIFAAQWNQTHRKQGYAVEQLSGFCMAFKKSLLRQIGGMDERFTPGYYEDTDFSLRARIAGKKLWVANDVFIHHHGSGSFKTKRKKLGKTVIINRKKFYEKWNIKNMKQINALVKREQPFNEKRHYVPY
ncbi:glycosyltransferase family 2 protein [Cytobacillus sp. FSL H8-0458]|uniref:glycosyltransferase family 2 protein n=1 Tax=Cytobacillus sp. FSL H8-0458 TaxID=2975346 RepID=UPI0030FBA6A7